MSKIANWVFGSFFRTIGRLLVFILLGVIIAHFIDFGSLKDNFSITDLFLDKVKADTLTGEYWENYYTNSGKTNEYSYYIKYTQNNLADLGTGLTNIDFYLGTNIQKSSTIEYVKIPWILKGDTLATSTTNTYSTITLRECVEYFQSTDLGFEVFTCNDWNSRQQVITIPTRIAYQANVSLRLSLRNSNTGKETMCNIDGDYFKCDLENNVQYNMIRVLYNVSELDNNTIQFGIHRSIYQYVSSQTQINNSINQQTQQQQQQHQETMNSTTTEAESEATSFFGDFEDQDFGGLSGIVTAPLNTIRSLLSSTCTNLVLPLPFVNKNLTLPCMTSIYSQHFGAFFTLYQTIILAIVAYRCIRSIFYDVHGFTNPDDDRIEVMDL